MSFMEAKIVCCIVARTNSSRLPEKVLKKISGRRMVEHIIDRMKLVSNLNEIYIATSSHPDDEVLSFIASENNIKVYRGSELSVIDRLLDIAELEKADYVVRVTGDNIYTDSKLLEILTSKAIESNADYARVEGAPIGVTAEIMKVAALKDCLSRIEPELSEYLMLYMFDPEKYKTMVIDVSGWVPPYTSLTVDTQDDWDRTVFIEKSIAHAFPISLGDIVQLSESNEIPHFYLKKCAKVKLPKGKFVTLEEFAERQKSLAKKSQVLIALSQQEYLDV